MKISVERSSLMTVTKQVGLEMDAYVEEHKGFHSEIYTGPDCSLEEYLRKTRWNYLNNFHCSLSGGVYRKFAEDLSIMDTTHIQYLLDYNRRNSKKPCEVDLSLYSEPYLSQTPRGFFEMIDEITEMKGISRKRISMFRKTNELQGLNELVLPVYIQLRALGYGHHELTN